MTKKRNATAGVVLLIVAAGLFVYDGYLAHQLRVHLRQGVEQSRQAAVQISKGLQCGTVPTASITMPQWQVVGEHKCPPGYKADHVGNHLLCPEGETCEDFVACFPTKILNRCK